MFPNLFLLGRFTLISDFFTTRNDDIWKIETYFTFLYNKLLIILVPED